jgi:hypothetical protein
MIRTVAILTVAALGLTLSAAEKSSKGEEQEAARLAKAARTADEHRTVARLYQERAAALEEKAKRHEERADSLARREGYNPMKYKWPAMVQGPIDLERSKAMQARRAARESLALMDRHLRLAEEAPALAGE